MHDNVEDFKLDISQIIQDAIREVIEDNLEQLQGIAWSHVTRQLPDRADRADLSPQNLDEIELRSMTIRGIVHLSLPWTAYSGCRDMDSSDTESAAVPFEIIDGIIRIKWQETHEREPDEV